MLAGCRSESRGAVEEEIVRKLDLSTTDKTKGSDEAAPNFAAILRMIKPEIEAQTTAGTKKQKSSYISNWVAYCAAYNFSIISFGRLSDEENKDPEKWRAKIWEEMRMLGVFVRYVVLHLRRRGQAHNSVSHTESAFTVVLGYYQGLYGRIPDMGWAEKAATSLQ